MEEKERYELNDNDCIIDNEKNMAICDVCDVSESPEILVDLLNQQDKRIKELEDLVIEYKNKLYRRLDQVDNLIKENQELKQTIQTMHQNVRNSSLEDVKHIEALKEEIEDWREENQQLKLQLAESEKELASIQVLLSENAIDRKAMEEFKIGEDEYDLTDEDARNSLCCEVEELKQQVEELEENYKRLLTCFYSSNKRYFEILDKYEDINFKFKQEEQQLHNLPKKIVEEIKFEMSGIEDILINCGNGKEDALSWFNKILQTILKKYGEENESK